MSKKTKVVFIWRFMFHYRIDLFERISAAENIDFTMLYGKDFPNSKVNYKGDVNFDHHQLKSLRYGDSKKGRFLTFWPFLFFRLVMLKPEVIVYEGESNMLNNIAVYLYSVLFNKKIAWWGLGLIPGFTPSFWQKLYRPLKILFLRHSKYVIGYSEYSRDYYSSYVDRDKIVIAHNCLDNEKIDEEIVKYKEEAIQLKKDLGFEDKFVIIYVGALIKQKKIDRLIESYGVLKKKHSDCALVVVGGGPMEDEVKEYVSIHDIKDVHFAGKIYEGISKYFLLADLFVLPGLGGLSIFEAMVHSLPVICASADGTEKDLVQEGENGFILETDSVQELTDRIDFFLKDKSIAPTFGKSSREVIKNKINIKNKVNTFLYVIENCSE